MTPSKKKANRPRAARRDLATRTASNVKGGALNPGAQILPYIEQNNALGGPDTKLGTQMTPSQTKVLVAG
jgi:hypothetical protein